MDKVDFTKPLDLSITINPMSGKPVSSYCPDYSMIPIEAIDSLAKRYELGAKKYGRDSWRGNMQTHGPQYINERLNHMIQHCRSLQDKINGIKPWDKDDDVGGMLWGASIAAVGMVMFGFDKNVDPTAEVE